MNNFKFEKRRVLKPAFQKMTGLDERIEFALMRTTEPHVVEVIGLMRAETAKLRMGEVGLLQHTVAMQSRDIIALTGANVALESKQGAGSA